MIDAHQHCWKLSEPFDYQWLESPSLKPIHRDRMPEDLADCIGKAGVDRTVLVQTQHDLEENRWALRLAEQFDWIAGVVGWVDLRSEDCEAQLQALREHPKFVGIRHVTQDEPDDDFIVRSDVMQGLRVLEQHRVPFDLLFYTKHLRHAATLAKSLPELPMVIDHLGKPEIKAGVREGWTQDIQAAASFPNVYCKLSGMVTEADWQQWKPADLKPYVETVLEAFGPSRCMFGSDWPLCELAGGYQRTCGALQEITGGLSKSERDQIFGATAIEFYSLGSDGSDRVD